MKNCFLIISLIGLFIISCKKNDNPSPSSNNHGGNPNDTTKTDSIANYCGDLNLVINYKGVTRKDSLGWFFFLNSNMNTNYYPCNKAYNGTPNTGWIYDNVWNVSSGNAVSPPINKSYFQTWTYPKKFEIGDSYANPSTPTNLKFYFMFDWQRAYYTGEDIAAPGNNSVTIIGKSDTTNSYLEITSAKIDNRDYGNGYTCNSYNVEKFGQEIYIITANFKVIRLITDDTITGSFTTQMLVDPNH